MKRIILFLLGAAFVPFFSGCISKPMALSAVGPDPASGTAAASGANGRLQVFSATQTRTAENTEADYNGYFYPHSSYEIKDDSGQTVKYVRNRANFMDESPDVVRLPAGHYNVVAESTCCGLVTVPVVIEQGKTTAVHLDGNWMPPRKTSPDQLVGLPDGAIAGWSSTVTRQ
jgi:hypothetical protein